MHLRILILGLCACTGPTAGDPDDDKGGSVDTDVAETDVLPPEETDPETDSDPPAAWDLRGTLVGVPGVTAIMACTERFCLNGETDPSGAFSFLLDPPAHVAIKTHEDLEAEPRRAAALRPCVLVDTPLDVGEVYVPTLPAGVRLGPSLTQVQALDAGDGLTLTLRRGDLRAAFGDTLLDVAARRLPDDRTAPYAVPGEALLAVYALHPFAATSESPVGLRVASELPAGTPVWFRTLSEIDGALSAPVAGRADGSALVTEEGLGITQLTWLVVTSGL